MALERRNPLPPGIYWQTFASDPIAVGALTAASLGDFNRWQAANRQSVSVVSSSGDDVYTWVLFRVSAPVSWPAASGFGYPTIASETTSSDVLPSNTGGPSAVDRLTSPDTIDSIVSRAGWLIGIGVAVFAVTAAIRLVPKTDEK